jgi:uncharacterized protein YndB with AHSA1/START domain
VTVSIVVSAPPERVFDYLKDIANHPEFTDHFLVDWHLTRIDSVGRGAGARFRVKAPGVRFSWADVTFAEVDPPHRIVEVGRMGKNNRVRVLGVYELSPGPPGTMRVRFTLETFPATLADRLLEAFGAQRWTRRKLARAMRRLRAILEQGERGDGQAAAAGAGAGARAASAGRGGRVTVAGG